MIQLNFSELATVLECGSQKQTGHFSGVSTDSRTLKPGELFLAITGPHFDGHDFVADAATKGALAAVVEHAVNVDLPQYIVSDVRRAYAQLAAHHRQQFNIPIIAVTGSLGKTTTKEMITAILKQQYTVLASVKSFNNDIGVPYMLCQLNSKHERAVLELGADKLGEIAANVALIKPQVAVLTNAAEAHLAGFKTMDTVAKAKGEILLGLAAKGAAVLNADDRYFSYWRDLLTAQQVCLSFGTSAQADVQYHVVELDAQGYATCRVSTPQGEISVKLTVMGRHHAANCAAAVAAACALNIPLPVIRKGLETMPPVYQRLILKSGYAKARILDDTYNAIPSAVKAALHVLADYPGKRIAILGDMRELGDKSEDYHRAVGELARELGIDGLYSYGESSALISESYGKAPQHFTDQQALIAAVKPQLNPDVTVLVKGSRSMQMEHIVAGLMAENGI